MKKIALILIIVFTYVSSFAANLTVSVSIEPQKFIITEIAKDKVKVNVMNPKGGDPHSFSPKAEQAKMIGESKFYFKISIPFEESFIPQLAKSYKGLTFVDTIKGVDLNATDPHVWTSPKNMLIIAKNTLDVLTEADPENKDFYKKNYDILSFKINELDSKFKALVKDKKIKYILVYHPSWGYFAKDYGIMQLAVEKEGKTPKPNELKETVELAKKEKIKVYIIEPSQNLDMAKVIAKEIGAEPVVINSLSENWFDTMDLMYNALNKE